MDSFEFVLNFNLPHHADNAEDYLDALYEAGCDDATVGVGRHGMIGLDFKRTGATAEAALRSAIRDVRSAIPAADLVRVGPDLIGLTDMAEIFGFSRQNMRKYATGQLAGTRQAFPAPVIVGEPSLWHLAEIVAWLRTNTTVQPSARVLAVSKAAAEINHEVEAERLKRIRALA